MGRNRLLDNRPTSPGEFILIRVGHHLWRSMKRKEWPNEAVFSALETVWDAKETLRLELRRSWLEVSRNRTNNLLRRAA
jgi:hypothetical protein